MSKVEQVVVMFTKRQETGNACIFVLEEIWRGFDILRCAQPQVEHGDYLRLALRESCRAAWVDESASNQDE